MKIICCSDYGEYGNHGDWGDHCNPQEWRTLQYRGRTPWTRPASIVAKSISRIKAVQGEVRRTRRNPEYFNFNKKGILREHQCNGIQVNRQEYYKSRSKYTKGFQAGFSTGKPWLPVNPNYLEVNNLIKIFQSLFLATNLQKHSLSSKALPIPTDIWRQIWNQHWNGINIMDITNIDFETLS